MRDPMQATITPRMAFAIAVVIILVLSAARERFMPYASWLPSRRSDAAHDATYYQNPLHAFRRRGGVLKASV